MKKEIGFSISFFHLATTPTGSLTIMSQFPSPGYPPQPGYQPPYGTSGPPASSGSNTLMILLIVGAVLLVMFIACGGILAALLLPAVQAAREAARRQSCANNMMQIGFAMHNYHSTYGQLPPAYTTDDNGRPLHSWRTILLPYMEQQALYDSIDLSKPWDDPVNQLAAQTVVSAYSCPSYPGSDPTLTTYVAVVDPKGVMSGSKANGFQDVLDGTSNTILFVETESRNAVHWMSPADIELSTFLSPGGNPAAAGGHSHVGGGHVCLTDGAVRFITDSIDRKVAEALVTKDGAEVIPSF
jgi:type II secretory pathway pseudopilin PulG